MMGARRAVSALMEFSSATCTAGDPRKKNPKSCGGRGRRGLCRRSLDLRQRRSDFLQVRHDGNVVIFEPSHFARFIDDGDGSAGNSLIGQVDAIFFANGAARMKV